MDGQLRTLELCEQALQFRLVNFQKGVYDASTDRSLFNIHAPKLSLSPSADVKITLNAKLLACCTWSEATKTLDLRFSKPARSPRLILRAVNLAENIADLDTKASRIPDEPIPIIWKRQISVPSLHPVLIAKSAGLKILACFPLSLSLDRDFMDFTGLKLNGAVSFARSKKGGNSHFLSSKASFPQSGTKVSLSLDPRGN